MPNNVTSYLAIFISDLLLRIEALNSGEEQKYLRLGLIAPVAQRDLREQAKRLLQEIDRAMPGSS